MASTLSPGEMQVAPRYAANISDVTSTQHPLDSDCFGIDRLNE
ncbi:MAG: hypothetical protein QF637_06815 [Acidimicrobiales bacterium]|nr:hypothetical protein [Acidimicrobiales bacterium]